MEGGGRGGREAPRVARIGHRIAFCLAISGSGGDVGVMRRSGSTTRGPRHSTCGSSFRCRRSSPERCPAHARRVPLKPLGRMCCESRLVGRARALRALHRIIEEGDLNADFFYVVQERQLAAAPQLGRQLVCEYAGVSGSGEEAGLASRPAQHFCSDMGPALLPNCGGCAH